MSAGFKLCNRPGADSLMNTIFETGISDGFVRKSNRNMCVRTWREDECFRQGSSAHVRIISGGFNVYPQTIEQAIYEYPKAFVTLESRCEAIHE